MMYLQCLYFLISNKHLKLLLDEYYTRPSAIKAISLICIHIGFHSTFRDSLLCLRNPLAFQRQCYTGPETLSPSLVW